MSQSFLRLVAALSSLSYCRAHDVVHSSDLCPECMKPRLRSIEHVDHSSAATRSEWAWPARRDEEDHLVLRRSGSGKERADDPCPLV